MRFTNWFYVIRERVKPVWPNEAANRLGLALFESGFMPMGSICNLASRGG